jgi:hypothetical protein
MIRSSYKTSKGTDLPILNLRGREYLEVKYRIVWFREDHPDWSIETEMMNVTETEAYARAIIRDEQGRIIATSHKFENIKGFPDFIEKAETGAIGRALALIGYGTQFCADELDEGQRIVDSPVEPKPPQGKAQSQATKPAAEEPPETPNDDSGDPGEYRITFGRKYKGKKLKEVPRAEIEGYIEWLEGSDIRPGTALSNQLHFLKNAMAKMYPNKETDDIPF